MIISMDADRLTWIWDPMISFAEKTYDLEGLFRPGTVLAEKINPQYNKPAFVNFVLFQNRKIENTSVRNLYFYFHRNGDAVSD
ncbi:hypothetical protein [Breznakiella homolactica]|uniref:Uncharacterized protein n=1 Tax=Breznakiella homolactica TaxID=2798577 RepID=A0A7T8B9N3_9SPIR|nr:hypothetical protein [Breznakiella homolactica]QQO09799.1 hypothetical protein JFL75_02500 [Breznakiella homolactica]